MPAISVDRTNFHFAQIRHTRPKMKDIQFYFDGETAKAFFAAFGVYSSEAESGFYSTEVALRRLAGDQGVVVLSGKQRKLLFFKQIGHTSFASAQGILSDPLPNSSIVGGFITNNTFFLTTSVGWYIFDTNTGKLLESTNKNEKLANVSKILHLKGNIFIVEFSSNLEIFNLSTNTFASIPPLDIPSQKKSAQVPKANLFQSWSCCQKKFFFTSKFNSGYRTITCAKLGKNTKEIWQTEIATSDLQIVGVLPEMNIVICVRPKSSLFGFQMDTGNNLWTYDVSNIGRANFYYCSLCSIFIGTSSSKCYELEVVYTQSHKEQKVQREPPAQKVVTNPFDLLSEEDI
jgi:hypothetical protein